MKKWKSLSRVRLYSSWNSPGHNTGEGSLSLIQGIFPTQGLNPRLLHCRQILYQLSYEGSPTPLLIYWLNQSQTHSNSSRRNMALIIHISFGVWSVQDCSQVLKPSNLSFRQLSPIPPSNLWNIFTFLYSRNCAVLWNHLALNSLMIKFIISWSISFL